MKILLRHVWDKPSYHNLLFISKNFKASNQFRTKTSTVEFWNCGKMSFSRLGRPELFVTIGVTVWPGHPIFDNFRDQKVGIRISWSSIIRLDSFRNTYCRYYIISEIYVYLHRVIFNTIQIIKLESTWSVSFITITFKSFIWFIL